MFKFLFLIPLIFCLGCPPYSCAVGATRCDKNIAEICGSNNQWQPVADCGQVSRQSNAVLVCCALNGGDGGVSGNICMTPAECANK